MFILLNVLKWEQHHCHCQGVKRYCNRKESLGIVFNHTNETIKHRHIAENNFNYDFEFFLSGDHTLPLLMIKMRAPLPFMLPFPVR